MLTNKKQIGLLPESRGVVNPTLDSVVSPVSALNTLSQEELLINNKGNNSFLYNKNYGVNKMEKQKYLDQKGNLTDEYYGYLYLTIDQKHNLLYVGQKKGLVEKTKYYYGSGNIIRSKIKSRGNYFLKKIVLGVCYSKEELNITEEECIYFFRSYGSDGENYDEIYGYNLIKNNKIGKRRKGEKHTKESKRKMSVSKKGIVSWCKGLTKETDERVKKRSESRTGIKWTLEARIKYSINRLGIKFSEEHLKNLSESHMGQKAWNEGIPQSEEAKKKNSEAHTGKNNPQAKKFIITTPEGEEIFLHGELESFCKNNNISIYFVRKLFKGEIDNYKGWKCRYA